jgi:hypothetical protein
MGGAVEDQEKAYANPASSSYLKPGTLKYEAILLTAAFGKEQL